MLHQIKVEANNAIEPFVYLVEALVRMKLYGNITSYT